MFNFFESIASFIGTIVNFVISMFETILFVIQYMRNGLSYCFTAMVYMPSFIRAFILAFISYSVIITLLNQGE